MINMKVLLLVIVFAAVPPVWNTDGAAFNVSLELQGGNCSDQLTLICRHSDILSDPSWLHNGTVESSQLLDTAFPGAKYSFQSNTEHRVTISGVGNVQALDRNIIQCVYSIQGKLIKSNAVKYSFIPPDYRPALSLVSNTNNFSERLCTFNYSYQESCSLYPRCTPYFSVEHTVSPQSAVSKSSSGCGVEYTIHNLMRCVSYQSTATALLPNQRGIPVVVGDTVMLSPGRFTITSVSIGMGRDFINVTYMENEPDCPGYPTERYTVDVDGVQVADLTADAVQSLAINHANGSVTLSLPLLNQPLPENATTLNMTKYNTVPTNRSDVTGNIVTEMVTWVTSAVFDLSQESSAPTNGKGAVSVGGVVGAIISVTTVIVVIAIAVALVIARKRKPKKCGTCDLKATAEQKSGAGDHTSIQETGGIAKDEYVIGDGYKLIRRELPKVDIARRDSAGGVETEKTTSAIRDVASIGHDNLSDGHVTPMAPVTVAAMSEEGSYTLTEEYVVSGKEVKQSPPLAAKTEDDNLAVPEEESHPATESTKQPKVDLIRNPAGGEAPQKTICAFDASTGLDHRYRDKAIPV